MSDWTAGSSNLRPMRRFASVNRKKNATITTDAFKAHTIRSKLTKNRISWIHSDLIFRRISDQSFGFREGHITRCCSVSLIVRDDFHFSMLKNSNTGVRGTKIDPNGWSFRHFHRQSKRKITKSAVYRPRCFQHKLWNTMSFEMYKVTWSIFRPFAPVPLSPVRARDLAGGTAKLKDFRKISQVTVSNYTPGPLG